MVEDNESICACNVPFLMGKEFCKYCHNKKVFPVIAINTKELSKMIAKELFHLIEEKKEKEHGS